jgi:hypothetical protein
MHDSGKSDGAIIGAASRWQGLLVFLVIVIFFDHLLLSRLLLRKGTSFAFKDSLYEKSL